MPKKQTPIAVVDLFCGIGGLTHGLRKANLNVVAGIDFDKSCKYAYEVNNNARFIGEDISKITGQDLLNLWGSDSLRILVGCAPCQPFSTHSNKVKDKENGSKWNLLNEYLRLVEETLPSVISMENVPNLSNKVIFHHFVNRIQELGYFVSFKNVYCPDYGIPQKRRRLVLLASLYGEISLVSPTCDSKNYKTVRDAIGYLPFIASGEKDKNDSLHFTAQLSDKNLQRIKSSVPNGSWTSWEEDLKLECHKKQTGSTYTAVYGRMSWDEPSPTITTQFYNYGTGRFGHPEQDRALSMREGAILQTFPENYKFSNPDLAIYTTKLGTHIGNAVPVELGYVIGQSIIKHLANYE